MRSVFWLTIAANLALAAGLAAILIIGAMT
jgi:hypothetical protein